MSPSESRAALVLLTGQAVRSGLALLQSTSGSAKSRRRDLLEGTGEIVSYFAEGSAALAADSYEDQREEAGVPGFYRAKLVLVDRKEELRRAVAWAADPLFDGDEVLAGERLGEVIQLDTANPFRDTMLEAVASDPQCVGWQRVTAGGCPMCRMLASRGAVYKEDTVHFAAHPNCHCTAQALFVGGTVGNVVNVGEYGSTGRDDPEARKALREALAIY